MPFCYTDLFYKMTSSFIQSMHLQQSNHQHQLKTATTSFWLIMGAVHLIDSKLWYDEHWHACTPKFSPRVNYSFGLCHVCKYLVTDQPIRLRWNGHLNCRMAKACVHMIEELSARVMQAAWLTYLSLWMPVWKYKHETNWQSFNDSENVNGVFQLNDLSFWGVKGEQPQSERLVTDGIFKCIQINLIIISNTC